MSPLETSVGAEAVASGTGGVLGTEGQCGLKLTPPPWEDGVWNPPLHQPLPFSSPYYPWPRPLSLNYHRRTGHFVFISVFAHPER